MLFLKDGRICSYRKRDLDHVLLKDVESVGKLGFILFEGREPVVWDVLKCYKRDFNVYIPCDISKNNYQILLLIMKQPFL